MNGHLIKPHVFPVSLLWIVAAHLIGVTADLCAREIRVPEWAKPFAASLPKVSPQIISEVDDLWENISKYKPDDGEKPNEVYLKSVYRLFELGEQADQALIWQYFKEPELPRQSIPLNNDELEIAKILLLHHGLKLTKLLEKTSQDPILEQWLLPLLLLRLDELQRAIDGDRIAEAVSTSELEGIEVYFVRRGHPEGVKRVNQIRSELVGKGMSPRAFAPESSESEIASMMEESKVSRRLHDMPFRKRYARALADKGILDPETAKRIADAPNTATSSQQAFVSATKRQTELQSAGTSGSPQTNWLAWGFVIISATGLLWLTLKKR